MIIHTEFSISVLRKVVIANIHSLANLATYTNEVLRGTTYIDLAFIWESTPQGQEHWNNISNHGGEFTDNDLVFFAALYRYYHNNS